MRNEGGGVVDRRGTERASAGRMVREAEGEHAGVTEGDIPGTRRRRARVEKRVRAAHYARDTSRSSDARGARGAHVELKRDRKRIVVAGRQEKERKIIERRGRKSARARAIAMKGRKGRRREEPLEKPGRERFVAVTDPLAVARARQSTFSARESRRRASQHRAIVARSAR